MRQPKSPLHPRFPRHTLRVAAQVVRLRDFRLVADRVENLSLGGLLVGPSEQVELGESLLVSFKLPESDYWIDVDATVCRVIHGRRPTDRARSFGAYFRGLSTEHILAIRRQLAVSPPAAPAPRLGRRSGTNTARRLTIQSGWTRNRAGHALIRWFDK